MKEPDGQKPLPARQAGSSVDCFKHSVLTLLLQRLSSVEAPFTYVAAKQQRMYVFLAETRVNTMCGLW